MMTKLATRTTRRSRSRLATRTTSPSRSRWGRRAALIGLGAIALQELLARWYYRRTAAPPAFDTVERTAWTPAWRESLVPLEWLALRASSVGRARNVARGDGAPVVLIHGFLTRGLYLAPLRRWLARIGYSPHVAEIGWNAGCFAALTDRLLDDLAAIHAASGRRIHVVGHSLGGLLGRAAAVRAPHLVASLAVFGTPARGLWLHPAMRVAAAANRVAIRAARGDSVPPACATFACPCETVRAFSAALPSDLPFLAIATQNDGITDWRACLDARATQTFTVRSSHTGLAFSPGVHEALAAHLAGAGARQARTAS
jgi:pimeloyl-ACP methyl ester carboxylesterase